MERGEEHDEGADRAVRALRAGLAAFALLFLATCWRRFLHVDEALLGEQAYWLARDGVVRSELLHGFLGYERRMYVFHKAFIAEGGLAVRALGWSAPALKLVAALNLALALGLAARAWSAWRGPGARRAAALALLLLLAHPTVLWLGFCFRPETGVMAAGLAAFLALQRALRRPAGGGAAAAWTAAAGALAGGAALVHLNGLCFVAAGAAAFFAARRPRAALGYAAVALAVASLYLADAWRAGALEVLAAQFRGDPALEESDFRWSAPLARLAREPRRLTRRVEDVASTLLLALALASAGRGLWRAHRPLVTWTLGAMLALAAIAQSPTPKYSALWLPWALALIALAAVRARGRTATLFGLGIALLLITGGVAGGRMLARAGDFAARHARMSAALPDGAVVLAHEELVFDQLERLEVRGLQRYRQAAERRGEVLTLPALVAAARADGVRFLLLDPRDSWVRIALDPDALPAAGPGWRLLGRPEGAAVLELAAEAAGPR